MAAKNVYNAVGTAATTPSALLTYLQGKQKIMESAGPQDDMYSYLVNPAASTSIVDALKGLFQAATRSVSSTSAASWARPLGGEWMISQSIYQRDLRSAWRHASDQRRDGYGHLDPGHRRLDGWRCQPREGGRRVHDRGRQQGQPDHEAGHGSASAVRGDRGCCLGRLGQCHALDQPAIYSSGSLQNVVGPPADNAALSFTWAALRSAPRPSPRTTS
jgi:hypothetical protein